MSNPSLIGLYATDTVHVGKRLAVTIDDACEITGLGRTKIYELIRDQKLKAVAIGRRRLVLMESIETLLRLDAA